MKKVDTGRCRAAWFPALAYLGGSLTSVSMASPKSRKGAKNRVTVDAISEGKSKGKIIDKTGKMNALQYIEIINGVGYALFLEYGYSRQAPYGMVRISMAEMRKGTLPKDLGKRLQARWNRFYYGPTGSWR